MRISDWSSDVCSSDLGQALGVFSDGQRVKALLLLCLARRPRLLLLDEPTTGLDPVARLEVLEALADVLRDESRSVLFSSHNTHDVEQRSEEHTSELQSLMRISYAVFCLKKNNKTI